MHHHPAPILFLPHPRLLCFGLAVSQHRVSIACQSDTMSCTMWPVLAFPVANIIYPYLRHCTFRTVTYGCTLPARARSSRKEQIELAGACVQRCSVRTNRERAIRTNALHQPNIRDQAHVCRQEVGFQVEQRRACVCCFVRVQSVSGRICTMILRVVRAYVSAVGLNLEDAYRRGSLRGHCRKKVSCI